jgi:hypothetical protein
VAGVLGAVLGRRRIDHHPADRIAHVISGIVTAVMVNRLYGGCHSTPVRSEKIRVIVKR